MSPSPDTYRTVRAAGPVELKVKGSRFLGSVFPAADEAEVMARLHAIRKSAYDATHHCWAFRLGQPEAAEERSDDDGEPSGTAGRPLLGTLQRHDVYAALVVVVRYFGGTKLGTGGLVRAYGEAAEMALQAAETPLVWLRRRVMVQATYEDLGVVEAELARAGDRIHGVVRDFDSGAGFEILVPRSEAEALRDRLFDACGGRATVRIAGQPSRDGGRDSG